MADFQLKVVAETQKAEQDLQRLDKTATTATKERKINIDAPSIGEVRKGFTNLGKNIETAANDIKKFYSVARQLPGIGDSIQRYEKAAASTVKVSSALASNTKAGDILAHSFEKAGSAVSLVVNNLAKLGFALFGLKEIVGVLQAAFGGFFAQTIGREIKLRETILKTQTTLASTSKVFKNGKEITDPYEKIVSLTGAVKKNIDSIRERSIALAGVTSNEVIEVFGIVASQISQVGGGLKEAEDLAINFAAALGTFGIPLYQARQEIGSILRGDITPDSYLAKALGITNEDVAKAKSQAGGLVKFLEDRLAAAVAGQKIAAQGFSGVVSNIKDLAELVQQRFGAKLLDPLLNALSAVFENLFRIREQIFAIADSVGSTIGRVASIGQVLRERTSPVPLGTGDRKDNSGQKALNDVQDSVQNVIVLIEGAAQRAIGAIAQIINTLRPTVLTLTDAFLRLGKAFIEIKVSTFETLARVLANVISLWSPLIQQVANLFNIYTRLLDLPVLQYFAELAATMNLLKRAGMDFITNAILIGTTLVRIVIPAIGAVGTGLGVLVGGVGAIILAIGKFAVVLGGLAASLASLPTIAVGVGAALTQVAQNLNQTGTQALTTGNNLNKLGQGFNGLANTAKLAGFNIIKSMGWTLLIQALITVVIDAFGRFQKAAEEQARTKRAELAIERLGTVYRNVGDDADYATKAARDFDRGLADAEYNRATERLEEIRKKLNDMRYEAQAGIQTWSELGRVLQQAAEGRLDPLGGDPEVGKLIAEQFRLQQIHKKYEAQQNKQRIEDNIKIEADKRINLEREIRDLRRQHENEIFQQRQTLAQKEVDIFRAAGELRIFQIEQANKKLVEGQEGASKTALEALNNYISVRERGELDIETAKQSLQVEIANMERSILNYRLDIEKKIFDLRKRAGENDMKSADYRAQQAAANGGGNTQIADIADQSLNSNAQAWLAVIRAAEGTAGPEGYRTMFTGKLFSDLSKHPRQINSGGGYSSDAAGAYQFLSTTWDSVGGGRMDPARQDKAAMALAMRRGVDLSTAPFTPATVARLAPEWASLPKLNGASAYGQPVQSFNRLRNIFTAANGGQNAPDVSSSGASSPTLQGRSDIGDGKREAGEFAEAVRNVVNAMERLRLLQAALTNAKTKEAFDSIAQSIFQPVGMEQYQDQLNEVQLTYQALATTGDQVFDPERTKLTVDSLVQQAAAARELGQIEKAIQDSTLLKDQEKTALLANIRARHGKYVDSLREEEAVQKSILALRRGNEAIQQLRNDTANIYKDLEVAKLQNRLEAEGVSPERINAEVEKLRLRQFLNDEQQRLTTALTEENRLRDELQGKIATATGAEKTELQKRLDEALKRIKDLEGQLKGLPAEGDKKAQAIDAAAGVAKDPVASLMGQWKRELGDTRAMVASLAQTIQSELATAMSTAVTGVIEGTTTVREAFATMFRNIAKAFMDMAVQMIAKWLVMKALGMMFPGMGAAAGGGLGAGITGDASAVGFNPIAFSPGLSFLPGRASGGPVSARRPYMVGEKGPELFVPEHSGSVVSNDALGGSTNIVVNVDAKGTSVQGNDQRGNELGRLVGAAVRQELVNQKRPGGLLANG